MIGTVSPVLIGKTHPFYHVDGVENAVNIQSDIVGSITLQGPGAGMLPTASSMIEDLVYATQNTVQKRHVKRNMANHNVHKSEPIHECWLISGIKQKGANPSLIWMDEIADETYLVNGSKKDISLLAQQNQTDCFFQIIGGLESQRKEDPLILTTR